MPERVAVQIDGRELSLSHLDKPWWPDFTKGEALDYYARAATALLPHTRGRAASFVRFPDGVLLADGCPGERFYAKNPPGGTPPWAGRVEVPGHGGPKRHVAVDDLAVLTAMANLSCVEFHVPQWSAESGPERHDRLVFDLDPGEGAGLAACCAVGLLLREELAADGLGCWAVTSGGKGLHLYAALRPAAPAEAAAGYARRLAERLAGRFPEQVVARMAKALRPGRVFVDWSQNATAKTTSAPYTLRGTRPGPRVSTPVTWAEVAACAEGRNALRFSPADVLARLAAGSDPLAPLLEAGGSLPRTPPGGGGVARGTS